MEPGLRKKCHNLKGTAGPKRMRLMTQIAMGKKKAASKMGYIDREGSGPSSAVKEHLPPPDQPAAISSQPPKFVLPEPVIPDSDSDLEVRSKRMHIHGL